ncbi:MAG: hypothetical protein NTY14_02325 [Candidatus Omnitrophica bacterium]|nr:hypothetical protein [Candidatus Omnitrophota bacterium]
MKASKSPARSRKAQGALEYAFCLAAVLLAAVAMVTYVKRGVSGRYRNVVDAASVSAEAGQYEPYYYSSSSDFQTSQNTYLDIRNRGERISDFDSNFTSQGSTTYVSLEP